MINNSGIQLRLGDLIFAVLKRWKLILSLTFLGLIFGIILSAVSYMQGSYTGYEITSSFAIVAKTDEGLYSYTEDGAPNGSDYHLAEDMVDAVRYIMRSSLTMNRAIEKLRMVGITPRDITANLSISQYSSTQIMEVTLTWYDAEEGSAIVSAIIEAAEESLQEILNIGQLVVINEPSSSYTLSGTLSSSIWGVLAVLGFAAGVGFAVLELIMRPTLTNLRDVETVLGLETFGVIPKDDKHFRRNKSLLVEDGVSAAVRESYASAAYILQNRLNVIGGGTKSFYVTATVAGEGKTTVAANLAIRLSDMEKRVLLIDLDLRNPGLGRLFLNQVDYSRSLNALYHGDATQEEAVTTLTGYLDILPGVLERQVITLDGIIVELIKKLSENYDYVVIDAPPVGQESQTLGLNQLADTVLYVIRYDGATLPEIRTSLDKLDKTGAKVMGCVVNAAQNVSGMASSVGFGVRKETRHRTGAPETLIWERDPEDDLPPAMRKHPGAAEKMTEKSRKTREEKKDGADRRKRKTKEASKTKRGKKRGKAEQSLNDEPSDEAQEAGPIQKKNLFDELLSSDKRRDVQLNDQDAAAELYKLGIEGGWESSSDDAQTPEAEAEQKKD